MKKKSSRYDQVDVLDVLKNEIDAVEETLRKVEEFYKKDMRKLDRLSDKIAEIGGSWGFIFGFFIFLAIWIIINTIFLMERPIDPYPFILLNLFMSMLASIQAPVILMSTNRSARRDQARLEIDLEKDLRDLHIDRSSHVLLLNMHKDIISIKKKLGMR
ncbi:MAG: DUF1003 domain-containing protein [Nanoarchaeota archaeon]